jgi:hypothetical protein
VRALLLAALAALLPAAAGALEPRYDHRDSHGPVLDFVTAYDSVTASGTTHTSWRPALRAGWGMDVTGEGSEVIVAGDLTLKSWSDPAEEHVLFSATARYRTYFGTEEWKSYFEAGAYLPVRSRLAIGPLIGLGVVHDFSQDWGSFLGAEFGTAFGNGRVVTFAAVAGVQLRFALP